MTASRPLRFLASLLPLLLVVPGCLMAPAPPVVVETAFGEVRAESEATAREFAELHAALVPRVREALPGCQTRAVDLWVQPVLQVRRNQERPASVRGFTLLRGEFDARRIHLKDGGQSSWYLTHELVHALIGRQWRTLPGLFEEGLADVVAERLNPHDADHIRAHRLLNASAFTDGLEVEVSYSYPQRDVAVRDWERRRRRARLHAGEPVDPALIGELLTTSRDRLHRRWPELPEAFYGLAWLVTSRICERRGLEGLLALCQAAEEAGHDLVPADWLLQAAEIDLAQLDARFLGSCFGPSELQAAARLEPDLFAAEVTRVLYPWEEQFSARAALRTLQPTIRLAVGDEGDDAEDMELSFRFWPLRISLYRLWRAGADFRGPGRGRGRGWGGRGRSS